MSKNRGRGVREYCTGLWWPARRVSEHTRLPRVIECGSGGGGGVLPCNPSEAWTTHLRKQVELGTPSYINYINGYLKLSVLKYDMAS